MIGKNGVGFYDSSEELRQINLADDLARNPVSALSGRKKRFPDHIKLVREHVGAERLVLLAAIFVRHLADGGDVFLVFHAEALVELHMVFMG